MFARPPSVPWEPNHTPESIFVNYLNDYLIDLDTRHCFDGAYDWNNVEQNEKPSATNDHLKQ